MNPDKGKDEKSGGKPAGRSPDSKASGGAEIGGKAEKPAPGAPGAAGQEFFRRISPANNDPNRVIEVHADDYIQNIVVCRDDCLVLYKTVENDTDKLDIVMQININHTENKVFSIFRTTDEITGQLLFRQFREKLPLLIQCVPDVRTSTFALQNVLQLIRENPSWTAAHIAAHLGYTECFKNVVIQSQVNIACEDSRMTPLHVAVKAQQINSVKALVKLDARIDSADSNGDTALHYAATSTKDIIWVLTRQPSAQSVMNQRNGKGCTPLHLACMASGSAECVDSVERVVGILTARGVDVNIQDAEGNTALHLAVKSGNIFFVKACIAFGVDVDMVNNSDESPLHLAATENKDDIFSALIEVGAKRSGETFFEEVKKIFDQYSKSGGPVGGGSGGLTKENFIKWMKAAKLINGETGCSEQDFEKAFDNAAEGEKSLDFCSFKGLVENACNEYKKEPKEFFDKLIAAGPPKGSATKRSAF